VSAATLATLAISPLGTSLLLGLLALLLARLRRPRAAFATGASALLWLWLWSTPGAAFLLRASLESRHPALPAARLPAADAIVVLGGSIAPPTRPGGKIDLGNGADRVLFAAQLYHAGRAPLLVLSGGSDPARSAYPEAEAMRVFLRYLDVPDGAMLLEARSRNTRQNARFTAELLRVRRIERVLLVTSALHMERALREFRRAGLQAIPAPTDFEATRPPPWPERVLPDAGALEGSARAFKELVGQWLVCRGPCR